MILVLEPIAARIEIMPHKLAVRLARKNFTVRKPTRADGGGMQKAPARGRSL
jgi:hypothetical protein